MAQGETSDFEANWDYDGTPGEYPETSDRLFDGPPSLSTEKQELITITVKGSPKFLTSPKYSQQQNGIRWRISGQRPLTVKVYKNGAQIDSFTHSGKGSVLSISKGSRWRCGEYQIRVSNREGAVIQRLEIRREHLYHY